MRVALSSCDSIHALVADGDVLHRQPHLFTKNGTDAATDASKAFTYQGIDRVAGLYVSADNGTLALNAGGNINLTAASIINSGLNSNIGLSAGGNINLATITQGFSNSVVIEAGKQYLNDAQTSEVGTSIIGGGNIQLNAANVNVRAATIQAGVAANATNGAAGELTIAALNNINVTAGIATQTYSFANKVKIGNGGLFSSDGETVTIKTSNDTFAQGSMLGGNTVTLQAGSFSGNGTQSTAGNTLGNINVKGSSILSTNGTNLIATGNINVINATNTFNSTFYQQTTESGFLSGGGMGFTYGERTTRQTQNQSGTTAAASTIGASAGAVNILAGGNASITSSNILAGTLNSSTNKLEGNADINIVGSNVTITEARETTNTQSTAFFEQSGFSLSVNIPIIGMVQQTQGLVEAAKNTSNGRVQALGVAAIGLQSYNTYNQLQKVGANPASLLVPSVTLGVGTSTSSSESSSASDTSAGSNLQAGGNINIQARGNASSGAGDILIRDTNIQANNNVSLQAAKDILLQAARDTQTQTSTSSSSSSGVSVTVDMTGTPTSAGAYGTSSSGNSNGQSERYINTNVKAGNTLTLGSSGNTSLIGAIVSGNTTNVNTAGTLIIQSQQDKSVYTETGSSAGVSVGFGFGQGGNTTTGGSLTVGKSDINNNYQSVSQTSGIRAGAGGFNVQVGGNTTLIAGQITSNQSAIDQQLNHFSTNGTLTVSNLDNHLETKGSGYSITVGVGDQKGASGAGIGQVNKQASSTTVSAISAGNISIGGVRSNASSNGQSLNSNTTTGQNGTGITNTFNAAAVSTDINAQIQITKAFGQQASKAVGDYAAAQMDQAQMLKAQAAQARATGNTALADTLEAQAQGIADKWGDNGTARLALHTVIGGLTGGASGAAGALAGTVTAPAVAEALAKANITGPAASLLTGLASTLVGRAIGGTAGAATSFKMSCSSCIRRISR